MPYTIPSQWMRYKTPASIILFIFILLAGTSVSIADDFVKKTQESLVEHGFDPGPVDGWWGPRTEGALKKFQEKQGFEATGRLDRKTRKSLFTSQKNMAKPKTAAVMPQKKPEATKAPEATEKKMTTASDVKEKSEAPLTAEKKEDPPIKEAAAPVAPVKEEAKMAAKPEPSPEPAPAPKKQMASSSVKSSGPCPQTRKTKSAPSSFKNLDKTAGANLENGKKLFTKSAKPLACKQCHGDKGDGKGKLGAALKPKPRNFTCRDTMKDISVGQMFWIIKNGSPGTGMAAHKKTLKDQEIWDVVKYIRSTFMGGEIPAKAASSSPAASETVASAAPAAEKPQLAKAAAPAKEPKIAAQPTGPVDDSEGVAKLPAGVVGKGKYEESSVSDGGSIIGNVLFGGQVPDPIMEDLSKGKNVEFCSTHPDSKGNTRPRHKVVVADGKLKDTVVFIQNIEKGKAWAKETINFDFKTCDIFPKVSVARKTPKGMKNGLLTITNQDPDILHNPHGYSVAGANRKTLFNKPLPSKGDVADVTKSFKRLKPKKDGHFFLQCDQHNFMEADARVVWNPYYSISGGDGGFKIDQIPPGKYWVTAWHPYIGEVSKEVTVSGGSRTNVNFSLKN